jgi:hypothetical protein
MTRDPLSVCSSRLHRQTRWDKSVKYTIDELPVKYDEVYSFIIEQAILMDPKPKWMAFEKYIKGEYTEKLFRKFDIPDNEENRRAAKRELKEKINYLGTYKIHKPRKNKNIWPVMQKCKMMRRIIETMLEEL